MYELNTNSSYVIPGLGGVGGEESWGVKSLLGLLFVSGGLWGRGQFRIQKEE